jgi:peptidoglycan/LPS O-acetylase OafA/YrhL
MNSAPIGPNSWGGSVPLSRILPRGQNNFDLVRVIAAASVIVSHAFLITSGQSSNEPFSSAAGYNLGQHAVNVFFVLSGLLVSASLDRADSIAAFAVARCLRIFPALIVCVAVTAFLVGPIVSSLGTFQYLSSSVLPEYVLRTLALTTALAPLPGVFETLPLAGQVNIPIWSLKYEVFCYALLAVIAGLGIWRREAWFWIVMASLLLLHLTFETGHSRIDEHTSVHQLLRFSLCFFLGVAAYRLRHHLRLSLPGAALATLLFVLMRHTRLEESVSYAAIGYLALCVAAVPSGRLRELFAGHDISYGLYIYGWPVAQVILWLFTGIGAVSLAISSLLIAAILASLSWRWIEAPAIALKRYSKRPLPAQAIPHSNAL